MQLKFISSASCLALWLVTPLTYAETVTLKNGTTLRGSIVQMNDVDLTIETADLGQVVVKRRAIQSIQDVVPAAETPAASAKTEGSTVQNLNLNNNVIPNQNQMQPGYTPAPIAPKEEPAQENAKSGPTRPPSDQDTLVDNSEGSLLYGHLSFGMVKTSSRFLGGGDVGTSGKATWSLIGYRSPSSLYVNLLAESSVKKGKQDVMWQTAGFGIGYASRPPAARQTGGMFEAYGTLAYAQMDVRQNIWADYPSNNGYSYPYATEKEVHINFTGTSYGLVLGYTYFFSDGFGLRLGASASRMEFHDSKMTGFTDGGEFGFTHATTVSGDLGLAYRF